MSGFDDSAGRVIARRYRLLRRIGAGGMGRVWLAYDLDLACEVAVKEITFAQDLPEADIAGRVARARQEARLAARLRDHPHVATVHDVVEEDGLPYIVMAYVPGATTLGEAVRERGPLTATETARIGRAVLDALMAGHRIGILHRDVKPANILLASPEPDTPFHQFPGQVLLADYGVALKPDSGEPRLTATSALVGTPGFLAPERARGAPPSAASDLFALGATLYFAVSGNGPFDRDSEASTLTALLFEEPQPLDRAGALTPVLNGLLAKDPEQRMSGEEAARLLSEAAEARKTPPEPVHTPEPDGDTVTDGPQTPFPDPNGRTVTDRPPGGDGSGSAPPDDRRPKSLPPRRTSRSMLIALVAVVALLVGGGVWAGASLVADSGDAPGGSDTPSPTGPVKPYGENVELTKELHPGDCVSAVWPQRPLTGEPHSINVIDCVDKAAQVDGQVVKTDLATSQDDAKSNSPGRCKALLKETVDRMADAQSYALVPNEQGWDSGIQRTACLVFNKTTDLAGPVGTNRTVGSEIQLSNGAVGDCINIKWNEDNTSGLIYLADCATAHDEQVVGYLKAPTGMSFKATFDQAEELCSNKYSSTYARSGVDVYGWTNEIQWDDGFRYVMCTAYRPDGQKLTGDATSPASFTG